MFVLLQSPPNTGPKKTNDIMCAFTRHLKGIHMIMYSPDPLFLSFSENDGETFRLQWNCFGCINME